MRKYWIAIIATVCCSFVSNVYADTDLQLLKAAHRGDVASMRRIGWRMYKGCSRGNPSTGIEWLEKAGKHGDSEAMYLLGRIYAVKKNNELSQVYLERAANSGNAKAIAYLRKLEGNKDEVKDSDKKTPMSSSKGTEKKEKKVAKGKSDSSASSPPETSKEREPAAELRLVQQHSVQQQYAFPLPTP